MTEDECWRLSREAKNREAAALWIMAAVMMGIVEDTHRVAKEIEAMLQRGGGDREISD